MTERFLKNIENQFNEIKWKRWEMLKRDKDIGEKLVMLWDTKLLKHKLEKKDLKTDFMSQKREYLMYKTGLQKYFKGEGQELQRVKTVPRDYEKWSDYQIHTS